MSTESVIPYDLVATKMNYWYNCIKNNRRTAAEKAKAEVEQEIKIMEENQDVLVYFSLLEFRHQLMLEELYPNAGAKIVKQYEKLKETRGNQDLNGMLEYYYHFFMGMYYFRQKELVFSLNCYRKAELEIESIEGEEAERAEFYFKMAEVYYHMKQTYFSMNYAKRAYAIYRNQPTYGNRRVHCQLVITGNWLDNMQTAKALKHANQALEDAEKFGESYLIRKALFNIGLCYTHLEELDKASKFYLKALNVTEPKNSNFEAKTLCVLAFVKAKTNDLTSSRVFYEKSLEIAKKNNIRDIFETLKIIKGIYLKYDLEIVRDAFEFFEEKKMYPDMEWYGISIGDSLSQREEILAANEFYRKAIEARKQIQRGEILDEN
ncbi:tetratricopeptide repeat protein [Bacillus swezeyi]|uniref:Rap family tetratricopeptide repeat protein n=1 Tax=Bacillus swezeyi TaxID=1925020 RepID=UPI002E2152AB|nr:tetratricopeptide repeat protein [Bacillus swezeyi]